MAFGQLSTEIVRRQILGRRDFTAVSGDAELSAQFVGFVALASSIAVHGVRYHATVDPDVA